MTVKNDVIRFRVESQIKDALRIEAQKRGLDISKLLLKLIENAGMKPSAINSPN
jgi:hypothetical protein